MILTHICIGTPRPIAAKSGMTGIFKSAVAGPLDLTPDGLAGDSIIDRENHGGTDQAVYLIGAEDMGWWETELGHPLPPGHFGENLRIAGLGPLCLGDRLHIGGGTLEITAPRLPCVTLAARMGDPQFVKRFLKAGRPGAYARVIESGQISAGATVRHHPFTGPQITMAEVLAAFASGEPSPDYLAKVLQTPAHHKLLADCATRLGL